MTREQTRQDTTQLLQAWQTGDKSAAEQLLGRLYPDLHRLSSQLLQRFAFELSLHPSDLVQDLYLKLAAQSRHRWESRGQFFGVVARLLRRLIIDHERYRRRYKRGGDVVRLGLDAALPYEEAAADALGSTAIAQSSRTIDLLALGQALDRLAEIDASAARLVELKFFVGLSLDQIADVLEIGRATVARRWRYARSWLHDALCPEPKAN